MRTILGCAIFGNPLLGRVKRTLRFSFRGLAFWVPLMGSMRSFKGIYKGCIRDL